MTNQEQDLIRHTYPFSFLAESRKSSLGQPDPLLRVIPAQPLADVVHQQTQMQRGRIADLAVQISVTLRLFSARDGQFVQRLDRPQRMLIDRVAMIKIVLNQA